MRTLADRFLETAERRADHIAVADPGGSLSYRQLSMQAFSAADAVARTTDRRFVAIAMPACAAFPAAYFGVLLAGKTPVPLNFLQEPAAIAAIVADAQLDTILTVPPLRDQLRKLVPKVVCPEEIVAAEPGAGAAARPTDQADEVATLLYTSGTSGEPKGVMLTHRNLIANIDSSIEAADYTPDDVSLGVLPLFHTFGITCTMLLPLLVGAGAVYLPRFSAAAALDLIAKHSVTCVFAVPSVYRILVRAVQNRRGASTLRFCVSGGEALGAGLAEAFRAAFGVSLMEGYGLTETSPVVSINPPDAIRAGSVGRPLSWARVKAVGADDELMPTGEDGELLIRGDCVMKGYYRRPEETRAALTEDGWLRTGDIARLDPDGYLYITGRSKEMIISAGENIMPGEIEAALNTHPAVGESAVIAMPDPSRGEAPRAFVVLAEGTTASESELIAHCRECLTRIKVPRKIEFRAEFPHTLTGKVLKRKL